MRWMVITIVGLALAPAGVARAQPAKAQSPPVPASSPEPGWSAAEPPPIEPSRPIPGLSMIASGAAVSLVGLGFGAGALALYVDTEQRRQRCYDHFAELDLADVECEGAAFDGWPVVGSLILSTAAAHLLVGVPLMIAGGIASNDDDTDKETYGKVTLLLSPSALGLRVTY